jgi:5-methyltetrahydrofolate--homocysteine methyltransferase
VVTGSFLAMAISHGMTSAIMKPMHGEVRQAVLAADVLANQDPNCGTWIAINRDPGADASAAGGGGRRRGGRRGRRDRSAGAEAAAGSADPGTAAPTETAPEPGTA